MILTTLNLLKVVFSDWDLRKFGNITKVPKLGRMIAAAKSSCRNKILLILEKQKLKFFCSALFHMKTRVSVKYFVNDCPSKHFILSDSRKIPKI